MHAGRVKASKKNIRAADAKEVGVGNPAEETCCHPNTNYFNFPRLIVNGLVGIVCDIFFIPRPDRPPFIMNTFHLPGRNFHRATPGSHQF
jgi:hypothetical protein